MHREPKQTYRRQHLEAASRVVDDNHFNVALISSAFSRPAKNKVTEYTCILEL